MHKAKSLLKRDQPQAENGNATVPGLTDSAAFSADAVPADEKDQRSRSTKLNDKLHKAVHVVAHPHHAAKQHATTQITASERPWLRNQSDADQTWLDAHDQLDAAQHKLRKQDLDADPSGPEPPPQPPYKELKEGANRQQQTLEDLEEERRQLHAGWHMSKYVKRARVVQKGALAFPSKRLYEERDEKGQYLRTKWGHYIGHLFFWSMQDCSMQYIDPTNEVPYDREVLISHIERLMVASEAFQLWWMRVRKVYTWEDPWLTFKWLLLFLVLLKTGYVMSFYWGYLLVSVVTNRTGRHTRRWMRESHERAQKANERASMLSEVIVRHGNEHWLEPLLDEFGPWIQLQIGDVADFLEVSSNYYDWRNVRSTTSTCIAYIALFLVSAIPDLQFSIKVFWLAGGLYFFLSRPISTNFPRFRHAVDPIRWMYWESPTSSELTFDFLRTRAWVSMDQQGLPLPYDPEPDSSSDTDSDNFDDALDIPQPTVVDQHTNSLSALGHAPIIASFPARWRGQSGTLVLTSLAIRFTPKSRLNNTPSQWEHPYSRLLEVRKTKHPTKPGSRRPPHALTFIWRDDSKTLTPAENAERARPDHVDELYAIGGTGRDEAFNAIIGISGAWWMELQPEPKDQERMH